MQNTLTMIDYQFEKESHPFTINSYGNQKKAGAGFSYRKTQSILNKFKAELVSSDPRKPQIQCQKKMEAFVHGSSASAWQ